jgi:hypothetical protein
MDINYTFVFYLIVAILVICGGTYKLVDRMITAVLFFIGTTGIFIVYGLRWFSSKNSIFSKSPVPWPPNINTCPDFLTYYQRTVNGAKVDSCIDMIGVSKNGTIKVFPRDGVEPMQDEYYFGLKTNSSDKDMKNQEWCQKAIASGLTWEGITNGESCTAGGTPTAPGGGAGAGACPAAPSD